MVELKFNPMEKFCKLWLPILLGAVLALVFSCTKMEVGNNTNTSSADSLIPLNDAEIEHRIQQFKEQCEKMIRNPGLKNSARMPYYEAMWLLEATLNYTYGYPLEPSGGNYMDSCFIDLPKHNDDSVDVQDVAMFYSQTIDSLYACFHSVNWNDKHVILADLKCSSVNDPDELSVKVTMVVGKTLDNQLPFGNPFDNTDYWFWNCGQGKCGPYYPSGYGSDAAKEIEHYQQWFLPVYPPPVGYHIYYTDIEEIFLMGNDYINPDDLTPGDNQLDNLIFYNDMNLPNFHDCLDPSEMWFYLQGLFHVVADTDKAPSLTNPPLKDFISVSLLPYMSENIISNRPRIKYGIRHMSYDPSLPMIITQFK
jgi:hypothetical protein